MALQINVEQYDLGVILTGLSQLQARTNFLLGDLQQQAQTALMQQEPQVTEVPEETQTVQPKKPTK